MKKEKRILEQLEAIAKDILEIETLETRRSDELDFLEVPVWSLKEALLKAYNLGRRKGE